MIAYYDASGRYVWTGSSTVLVPGIPAPPPHPYAHLPMFVGEVDQATQYHDIGSNTPVHIPAKPGEYHVFDWFSKQWQDPRTLQDLKDAKWAAIKQARDAAEFSTFTYNGLVFDGDLNAQRRLTAYISVSKSAIAAGQPFSADFTLADNSLVTLSAQDFVGIELAKVQAVAAVFSHGAMLRNQIELATVVAELTSIAW